MAVCELVAMNLSSFAASVGSRPLIFAAIVGSWPNGMQLTSALLLHQWLTQCLPGFDHKGNVLRPSLLDARLHPMRACRVHDQRH
jgi:hypothetical protein